MRYLKTCLLLQIFCLLIGSCSVAQSNKNIVQVNAYMQESVSGAIPVDKDGNPLKDGVMRTHSLYVQTKGKTLPQWGKYYTSSGVYTIQAEEIFSPSVTVGKRKNGDSIRIISRRGNRLWRLHLVESDDRTPENVKSILKKNAGVLNTSFGGKQFMQTIAKEIELEPIFYP